MQNPNPLLSSKRLFELCGGVQDLLVKYIWSQYVWSVRINRVRKYYWEDASTPYMNADWVTKNKSSGMAQEEKRPCEQQNINSEPATPSPAEVSSKQRMTEPKRHFRSLFSASIWTFSIDFAKYVSAYRYVWSLKLFTLYFCLTVFCTFFLSSFYSLKVNYKII